MNSQKLSIGIIGDEYTLTAFMIAGVECNNNLVQVSNKTPEEDLKKKYAKLMQNKNLALLLICDFVYDKLQGNIIGTQIGFPCVIRIPSSLQASQ